MIEDRIIGEDTRGGECGSETIGDCRTGIWGCDRRAARLITNWPSEVLATSVPPSQALSLLPSS